MLEPLEASFRAERLLLIIRALRANIRIPTSRACQGQRHHASRTTTPSRLADYAIADWRLR